MLLILLQEDEYCESPSHPCKVSRLLEWEHCFSSRSSRGSARLQCGRSSSAAHGRSQKRIWFLSKIEAEPRADSRNARTVSACGDSGALQRTRTGPPRRHGGCRVAEPRQPVPLSSCVPWPDALSRIRQRGAMVQILRTLPQVQPLASLLAVAVPAARVCRTVEPQLRFGLDVTTADEKASIKYPQRCGLLRCLRDSNHAVQNGALVPGVPTHIGFKTSFA